MLDLSMRQPLFRHIRVALYESAVGQRMGPHFDDRAIVQDGLELAVLNRTVCGTATRRDGVGTHAPTHQFSRPGDNVFQGVFRQFAPPLK